MGLVMAGCWQISSILTNIIIVTVISESSVYFPWYWFVKYKTDICIPDVFWRQTNSEMVWEIYTPILYNEEWTSAMNVCTYDTNNILYLLK